MNSEFIKQILSKWDSLQQREKVMLSTMIVVLTTFIFYVALWRPISKDITKYRASVPKAEAALAVMRVQAAKIKSFKSKVPRANSGGLLTQLETAANQRGLRQYITKMEPDGDTGVRITIEGVSLNNLLTFLSGLHKSSGLRVDNATINPATETPGIVNARLVLKGAES